VYGKTAFLFPGDAEPDTEDYLLQKNVDFTATVLKVGHHGGRHSSTVPWLARIKPKVAVISVASHNDYGHPGKETLARLSDVGAVVFRTDENGEVTAVSDGATVSVTPERGRPVLKIPGEIGPEVATGPILPGERHLSGASLADQKRYGKDPAVPDRPTHSVPPPEAQFIASKRSHVFHKANCPAVAAIKDSNRIVYTSREAAIAERKPAEDCNP